MSKVLSTAYITAGSNKCQACWECIEACPKQVFGKVDVFWGLHKHIKIVNPFGDGDAPAMGSADSHP